MNIDYQQTLEQFLEKFPRAETARPLADLTSIGIGGAADLYYRVEKAEDLEPAMKEADRLKIRYFVLGGGTNTVFADEGYRGLVIHIMARKVALEHAPDSAHGIIEADAGALLSQVIAFALKNNLSGLEKLMGLPGTVGGAVRGNAGAFGTEIKDVFHRALVLTPGKGLHEAGPAYFKFSYRHSAVKASDDLVIKVYLKLEAKDCAQAVAEATEIIKSRITKQPQGRSSGSFFKNPNSQLSAGYLLDQCGCKGLQVGGAQVSHEHANWIINRGHASQKDLIELARIMREKVQSRFNLTLEPEVQLVGPTGFITL